MASRGIFGVVSSMGDSRRDNTICSLSFGKGIFSTRKQPSHGALQRSLLKSIWSAWCRLRRDRPSLQQECEAAKTEDSPEDARGKMFQESAGYWASAAEATPAQPAWVWPQAPPRRRRGP